MVEIRALTGGEHKEAGKLRATEQRGSASGDSVEELEEALATARARLQARLTDDIEVKRHEIDSLQQEADRLRGEASGILAEATEKAERMLHETNDTTQRVLHEAREAAEQIRREAERAAEQTRQVAAQKLEGAEALLSRVRALADDFLSNAAVEVQTLGTAGPRDENVDHTARAAASPEEAIDAARPIEETSDDEPAPEAAIEAAITRMVVHPLVGFDSRNRVKERLERLSEIKAVKLGAVNDDCFELLIVHPRDAKVLDGVVGIAPHAITLKQQKAGYIELELKDIDWLDPVAV